MESKTIKARENKVRRRLAWLGYRLQKSRTDGSVYVNGVFQGINLDDRGGYRIIDSNTNTIEAGEKFDLDLGFVELWAKMRAEDRRESKLAERAGELDMELRRDDDGCYWLDYTDQPDMRSLGPFDLDEVKDWLTAVENGYTREQIEEYMADRRWKRIHSGK